MVLETMLTSPVLVDLLERLFEILLIAFVTSLVLFCMVWSTSDLTLSPPAAPKPATFLTLFSAAAATVDL